MCVSKDNMDKCQHINKFGSIVRSVLSHARTEHRLICGLMPALALLERTPCTVLFCVVAETTPGDTTSHMHAVLLQAYCYEHNIRVIQVDNSEKLTHFCGLSRKDQNIQCALVTRPEEISWENPNQCLSKAEQTLTDFYECTFYDFPKPTIMLPPLS